MKAGVRGVVDLVDLAVGGVADHRNAQIGEVRSYLVGSAARKPGLDQCPARPVLEQGDFRARGQRLPILLGGGLPWMGVEVIGLGAATTTLTAWVLAFRRQLERVGALQPRRVHGGVDGSPS